MATRGNRPKDPAAIKGGVRGTHGLGDAPREPEELRPVAAQGGTASRTGGSTRGGTASRSHVGMKAEAPQKAQERSGDGQPPRDGHDENVNDESVGEEREFELSNAMAELETADQRAERREREARAARESAAEAEVLGDARFDAEERSDRNLDTVKTHGPGPKDAGKGTALKKHLQEHGIDAKR